MDLNQVESQVEDLQQNARKDSDLEPLLLFGDTLWKFKELVQPNLRNSLTKEEIARIMLILHKPGLLFTKSSVELWLFLKTLEIAEKFARLEELGIAFLDNKTPLELNEYGKKYVLILSVSPLDQVTNRILSTMTDSLKMDVFTKLKNLIEDGQVHDELVQWVQLENNIAVIIKNKYLKKKFPLV